MTSKEALKMLETRCRLFANDGLEIEETYQAKETIKKDLEDFEWLKSKLNFPFIDALSEIKDKERVLEILGLKKEKVKEWLEND